jgi:hypothetical protein
MPSQVVIGESKGSFKEFRERTIDAIIKMDLDSKKAGFYAAAVCDSFGGFFRAIKKGSITDEFDERNPTKENSFSATLHELGTLLDRGKITVDSAAEALHLLAKAINDTEPYQQYLALYSGTFQRHFHGSATPYPWEREAASLAEKVARSVDGSKSYEALSILSKVRPFLTQAAFEKLKRSKGDDSLSSGMYNIVRDGYSAGHNV